MKITTKFFVTLLLLLATRVISFAGPTEDLWTALKSANYPNALTAISAGADVKSLDPSFGTPLNFASCWADAEVVKALIDAKSEINFISPVNGYYPLMNAVHWGNKEAVVVLIAAGADLKIKNKLGGTLLATALFGGKMEIIKILVDAGADLNENYKLGTVDMNLLMSLNADYDPAGKITYIKNVEPALAKLNVTFSDKLKNVTEKDFSTLQEMAEYLISKGANPTISMKGTWGSLVFQSIEFGKTGVAIALIHGKADIETQGLIHGSKKSGFKVTPIMLAAVMGNNEVVEALCIAGANVNALAFKDEAGSENTGNGYITYWKTTESNTAVSLASDNNHPETVLLLRKYGGLGPTEFKHNKK